MGQRAELIGRSPGIAALRARVRALLSGEAALNRLPPLLITGETGTGKSLLARVIHEASSRAARPFVELNAAAIPEHLLEAELFGYERGAFTDARQAKPGLFQVAHRGTLFLDEVGLLPLSLQPKLLKVFEDGVVRRLGATRGEPADVCIISATNEDLLGAVRAKRFRDDLYHRLAGVTLTLPPLRELGDDVDLLAEHALARSCEKYGVPLKTLGPEARAAVKAYRWPGNVRELNSRLERAVLLCPDAVIPASALELGPSHASGASTGATEDDLGASDRERLEEVLTRTGWNISRTAAMLGITRNTVRARIARFGLRPAGPTPTDAPADVPEAAGGPAPAVVVAAAAAGAAAPLGVSRERGRPSIAVLPFRVEGESDPGSYFGDGVVEEIIGALASLRELLVISRSSTLRYRGTEVDIRVVGRDLGVRYVASGSVRRAGPRLRVAVELAEAAHGTVVWASRFDGIAEDLFALQEQIATRVVGTIAPHVHEAEMRRALRRRPGSLEAYDCTLRARAVLYRLNRDDFNEARAWLERAIALDPAYAVPYALLADWHSIHVHQGWSPDPASDNAEVIRLASAALERDSFDATALALCGHVKSLLLHEFDEAIALFDRAIAASPSSAIAWTRSSPTYSYIGDAREAIRRAEQGLRLSPLDLHLFFAHAILGLALYVAGEYEEGARWGRKAREENPRYTANLRFLALNLGAAGHREEAEEVGRALLALEPGFQVGRFVEGYAVREPERRDRLAAHLRRAGLPG